MACHLVPIATRGAPCLPTQVQNPVCNPGGEWLRNVTAHLQRARNPSPTRQRHNLLQISAANPDGLACAVHQHCALPPMQSRTRQGPDTGTGLASAGSTTDWCEKELAPGGHQEQGESRVTEFPGARFRKTSGVEAADQVATAPSAKSISGCG